MEFVYSNEDFDLVSDVFCRLNLFSLIQILVHIFELFPYSSTIRLF